MLEELSKTTHTESEKPNHRIGNEELIARRARSIPRGVDARKILENCLAEFHPSQGIFEIGTKWGGIYAVTGGSIT